MNQYVLIPASVYNKSFNTQSTTMQELPKYQLLRNPTCQIDSLKKEINKNIFAKADTIVDNILSFPRIKLSNAHTLKLDGVETGDSLLDFVQQVRH